MGKFAISCLSTLFLIAAAAALVMVPRFEFGDQAQRGRAEASVKAPTPVITAAVKEELFTETLEGLGTVKANESVTITPTVEDRVTQMFFEDGDRVKQGDILLKLDSRETEFQLAEARAALKEQRWQYERYRQLVKTRSASQARLEEEEGLLKIAEAKVSQLEARVQDYTIRAPFAGVLGIRQISPGAVVDSDTVITTLDDISTVKLDFTIPETFLGVLAKGMPITARSQAYPDELFQGEVTVISSRVDPETRSVTVRAVIANPDLQLRPGMLLAVDLVKERFRSLMVPEEAVIINQDRKHVLVVGAGDSVVKKEVTTNRRRAGAVEIVSGLEAGEQVVIEGTNRVRPGSLVQVVGVRQSG